MAILDIVLMAACGWLVYSNYCLRNEVGYLEYRLNAMTWELKEKNELIEGFYESAGY